MSPSAAAQGRSVLVTGAGGYVGRQLVAELAGDRGRIERLTAVDVHPGPAAADAPGVEWLELDVRDRELGEIVRDRAVDTLVHLAAVVTPGPGGPADLAYSIDVGGTRNVLEACTAGGVRHLVYTSSGAAYGYWPDNPRSLTESDALRGNDSFGYARNKRIVEEMLARARADNPELAQLVFRPGTILGESVSNQITAMFERAVVVGVRGSETPFVFIWDHDVVDCLALGVREGRTGIYNLAGDGIVTMREIAARMGKHYVALPAPLLRAAVAALHRLGLTSYGPEQVDFLRYRPVLSNERLKSEFGYLPRKTSAEVFELYAAHRLATA